MDPKTLKMLLQEKENLTLEFKERYSSTIDEDLVAFANTKGGMLLLGVADDSRVVGCKLTNALKAQINTLARNCGIEVHITEINGLVAIEVEEGREKPYRCGSGYYRRLDGNTQKMNREEERVMFRDHDPVPFEEKTNRTCKIADVSVAKVKRFLHNTGIKNSSQNVSHVLMSSKLMNEDGIKNAGILLFAKDVGSFVPQARMSLLRFKGNDKVHIFDRLDVLDDVHTQFEQAMFFLKKHMNLQSIIEGTTRKDVYDIPMEAWREAIANAIIHRDYDIAGSNISVEIYDDRVVIVNPGSLPKKLPPTAFGKISMRRNELLADVFYRMNLIEKAGTGIRRIQEKMRESGLPEPEFEMDIFFTVTLYRKARPLGIKDTVKGNQSRILSLIRKNPSITTEQLSHRLKINQRNIKNNLAKLKRKGLLRRVGSDKSGHWEVL